MSTTLELHPFSLAMDTPLESANQILEERRGIAVRIQTEDGIGVGEATTLPGWTEEYEACREALEALAGAPPESPGDFRLPASPAARHAIQLAVLDHAARQADLSLSGYITSKAVRRVPRNATIGNVDVGGTLAAAREASDRGFSVIKCKVGGRSIEAEGERLQALRSTLGPDVTLRLDANGAWTREETAKIWPTLSDLGIAYVEEPIDEPASPDVFESFDGDVGIALDETLLQADLDLSRWLEAVEAVILKPIPLGGIDRALAIGMQAVRRGVRPVVSGTVDGVIARTAALHLAASFPNPAAAGLATADRLRADLAPDPVTYEGGDACLPDASGLGTHGPWEVDRG